MWGSGEVGGKSVKDKERASSPIANFAHAHDLGAYPEQYLTLHEVLGAQDRGERKNLVAACKKRLGRQSYCMTTYRRYWVWEFPAYRVFVNNEAGFSFELILKNEEKFPGEPAEDPKKCWLDFVDRVCTEAEVEKVKTGAGRLAKAWRRDDDASVDVR